MAYTTMYDVVTVFESTFQDRRTIDESLVEKWFKMAIDEFSIEIEPLKYDFDDDIFLYYSKEDTSKENVIRLPHLYINILGYTIKKYYCEREYDKVVKRTNIIGKDLTLNNTDADKKNQKAELDYINEKLYQYYNKLKPTAYS